MSEANLFCRVVVSGDTVEVYQYRNGIKVGFERDVKQVDDETIKEFIESAKGEKRIDNLYRARRNIRRIIWSNQGEYTKFLTLTYKKTVLDEKKVKHDVTMFVQAMRRLGYDMKYLYVMEHQKERGEKEGNDGCLHVHMVVFIDKFIPIEDIKKCWKHGTFDIHKIEVVRNLAAYISKYITKETIADFGCRCYSCSLGLKRPKEERFYLEGYSDNTYTGLHPKNVLDAMNITYHSQMRHDFIDQNGETRTQVVGYYQGKWKGVDLIESARDYEE